VFLQEESKGFTPPINSEADLNDVYVNVPPTDVFVVDSLASAHTAFARLMAPELTDRMFACDTEVMDIDVTSQSPCCHGRVICFSIYCGPDVDFGGQGVSPTGTQRSVLWVDTYLGDDPARVQEAKDILEVFKPFFESTAHKKAWHNYSFDRHVMERMGVGMAGFAGDTMHMARLWDSSRVGRGGYSLAALSGDPSVMNGGRSGGENDGDHPSIVEENGAEPEDAKGKIKMKMLFGRNKLKKDGTPGKLTVLPPMEELQTDPDTRWRWIKYAGYDAKSTWDLMESLRSRLQDMPTRLDDAVQQDLALGKVEIKTMWDVYLQFWLPFGELLTDMEAAGMAVDRKHLKEAEEKAIKDEESAKELFRSWAQSKVPGAMYMNIGSGPQVMQLLFAGAKNKLPPEKKVDKKPTKEADKEGEDGEKKARVKTPKPPYMPLQRVFKAPNTLPSEDGKKQKKFMDITLHGVWGEDKASPLEVKVYTPTGGWQLEIKIVQIVLYCSSYNWGVLMAAVFTIFISCCNVQALRRAALRS
jgi:DNA polymerase I